MGKFRPKQGGGSSNALCTASAAEVLSGYQAITRDSPLPQIGTLAATGDAEAGNVLSGKTFYAGNFKNKLTGTMVDRGPYQYAGGFGSGSGYVAFNAIPSGYYHADGNSWAPEIRMNSDTFKTNVINYFGIGSVTNFSVAQYSSQTLLFTWANPGSGRMWSGIRIVGKQSGWPSNAEDGTVKWDSASGWLTSGAINTGTWYFRAWNYVTVSGGRWYGGYSQASIYNNVISGEATFTYSQDWTVPTAVRKLQIFLVGGGGGSDIGKTNSTARYGNGGGGGYTFSSYIDVSPGQVLHIVVGAGGYGGDGGASSIDGTVVASGGHGGSLDNYSGSGGSGGGSGGYASTINSMPGAGGSDGSNGGSNGGGNQPGYGQGSSTRCPWDSVLYSGGGGGGSVNGSTGGAGGDGGGGTGGSAYSYAGNGLANTGGGAGGSGRNKYEGSSMTVSGGSGIVRFRW